MSELSVEDIFLSHVIVIDNSEVQAKRYEHRNSWHKIVGDEWDNLAEYQKEHCTNLKLINRWWPGTSNREINGD